jgi:hypothetical protein
MRFTSGGTCQKNSSFPSGILPLDLKVNDPVAASQLVSPV